MKFSKNSPKSKSIERIQNSSPFNSINKKNILNMIIINQMKYLIILKKLIHYGMNI